MIGIPGPFESPEVLRSELIYQTGLAEDYRIARNTWRMISVWQLAIAVVAAIWRLTQ